MKVVLFVVILFAGIENNFCRSWSQRDSMYSSRALAAIKGEWRPRGTTETFERVPMMNEKLLSKRQTNNIQIHPWTYPLISWGFVNKDLNFALTIFNTLLVSRDSLMTFQERSEIPSSDRCFEVEISPANRNIIFLNGMVASWASIDGGNTFNRIPTTSQKAGLLFHPKNENWALIRGEIEISKLIGNLYVTKDLGKTWALLARGVKQYDWCQAGTNGVSEERICVIQDGMFKITDNLGGKWVLPLNEEADFFRIHDRFITLIAEFNNFMDLYVSSDNGANFRRALLPEQIPVGTLQESQFIEDQSGVIWIVVSKNIVNEVSSKGNLYVSDADGYKFTKVLENVHTINNWWDLELVHSTEGTLLANVLVSDEPLLIKTKITWDNGDTWQNLAAPLRDSNGTAIPCTGSCSLNIYGITTWLGAGGGFFGPMYTSAHAVGMILGTGSVGTYLPQGRADQINTYFSRDGGTTWDEIMKGSTIYEYGDFGGLIVMASNVAKTNLIYYSLNGGISFSTVTLPQTVNILNIVVASTQNERFIVIAIDPETGGRKFWGIDFSAVQERNCTTTDYESWESNKYCVLGHNTVYRRRKRDASCFSEDGLNKIVSQTNCTCVKSRDYECDFGFERTSITGLCVAVDSNYESVAQNSQCNNESTTYVVSSGYRKIPGDTCINETETYAPITKKCPVINITNVIQTKSESRFSNTAIIGIVLLSVVVVILSLGGGFLIGLRNENFRKKFPWVKAPAWVHIGYSNQLVEDPPVDLEQKEDDKEVELDKE